MQHTLFDASEKYAFSSLRLHLLNPPPPVTTPRPLGLSFATYHSPQGEAH